MRGGARLILHFQTTTGIDEIGYGLELAVLCSNVQCEAPRVVLRRRTGSAGASTGENKNKWLGLTTCAHLGFDHERLQVGSSFDKALELLHVSFCRRFPGLLLKSVTRGPLGTWRRAIWRSATKMTGSCAGGAGGSSGACAPRGALVHHQPPRGQPFRSLSANSTAPLSIPPSLYAAAPARSREAARSTPEVCDGGARKARENLACCAQLSRPYPRPVRHSSPHPTGTLPPTPLTAPPAPGG